LQIVDIEARLALVQEWRIEDISRSMGGDMIQLNMLRLVYKRSYVANSENYKILPEVHSKNSYQNVVSATLLKNALTIVLQVITH
jgi:hypothetical protein